MKVDHKKPSTPALSERELWGQVTRLMRGAMYSIRTGGGYHFTNLLEAIALIETRKRRLINLSRRAKERRQIKATAYQSQESA